MKTLVSLFIFVSLSFGCTSSQSKPSQVSAHGSDSSSTQSENEVRLVGVYVLPYYQSAQVPDGKPIVSVAKNYDEILSSNKAEDIVNARNVIEKNNAYVTPMTMMVLSIRLYDVGMRDESVFWFYAAKDRYTTLAGVLNINHPSLAQVEQATRDFAVLAGPVINGYAFCDLETQKNIRKKAFEWVKNNPYQAVYMERLPAKPGNRDANLELALSEIEDSMKQESDYLNNPDNVSKLQKARIDNDAGSKYCWK